MTPREEFGGDLRAQTADHEDRIVNLETDMTELTTVILGAAGPLGTRVPEGSMKWQIERIYLSTNGVDDHVHIEPAEGEEPPKVKAFSFSIGERGNVSLKFSKRAAYLIAGVVAAATGFPVFDWLFS